MDHSGGKISHLFSPDIFKDFENQLNEISDSLAIDRHKIDEILASNQNEQQKHQPDMSRNILMDDDPLDDSEPMYHSEHHFYESINVDNFLLNVHDNFNKPWATDANLAKDKDFSEPILLNFHTSLGEMAIELYWKEAPKACKGFWKRVLKGNYFMEEIRLDLLHGDVKVQGTQNSKYSFFRDSNKLFRYYLFDCHGYMYELCYRDHNLGDVLQYFGKVVRGLEIIHEVLNCDKIVNITNIFPADEEVDNYFTANGKSYYF